MNLADIKGTRALVMGLGALGGGVATAKWLVKHGAKVTVTDLRTRNELAPSMKALGEEAKKITFVLGRHRTRDFQTSDLVVVNPAVRRESTFLKVARRAKKETTNDARIFFDLSPNPTVAVTGTRGKTTTANWIAHFLRANDRAVFAAGNTPERPLMQDLDRLIRRPEIPAVLELSSWQLEFLPEARRAPDVAVITNLYRDHLNRYRTMDDYARAKANIFKNQLPSQTLILNAENAWTRFFMKEGPRARTYFFSTKPLANHTQGISLRSSGVFFSEASESTRVASRVFVQKFVHAWGSHNLENLFAAILTAHLAGVPWRNILARVNTLPGIPYRQEIVIRRKNLTVVNDSGSTSPDAAIAALRRFGGTHTHFITGGTDKKLEFRELALVMKKTIGPEHTYFLNGSATKKLLVELQKTGYFKKSTPQISENLSDLLRTIGNQLKTNNYQLKTTILFSPGAASFEKFKNEFDRGNRFTREARRVLTR
ncbi:MAG: UDP-N-acetylmuramoyl-L-alanine--D-glutamate ligase [Candidatus Jorgensenbacteria bacterium]|nr:UDP-N-acetylmuramoyl-L-alanine--D-glutamate ligase [Candidatus Jorgensenbacteria bacterium]